MASAQQLEARLKQAHNQLLALKNDVNEKELALLENDAAFAKQLFHMKKLLGEREKVVAAQRNEIVQLQRGVHHAQATSSQAVQAQFNDFLGQINALKVVVVQLERKLREKADEQLRLRRAYDRAVRDRGSQFDERRAVEQQSSSQAQVLQRKVKSLLQANAALTEQHRREQESYEIELQRLRGQLGLETSRGDRRDATAGSAEHAQLRGQVERLLENEGRLQQTISIMADRLQEQEAQASTLRDQEARVQQKANELELARAQFEGSVHAHSQQRQQQEQQAAQRPQQHHLVAAAAGGRGGGGPVVTSPRRGAGGGTGAGHPGHEREIQAALEASQAMCIRLDDEVKALQQELRQVKQAAQKRQAQITGRQSSPAQGRRGGNGRPGRGGNGDSGAAGDGGAAGDAAAADDDDAGLGDAVDEDENVMQCAYAFLMRATALMTQIQCHLDGEVNSAQLPPPAHTRAAIYRGTPAQLCHALRSMEKAIPPLQERVTDAYAQSLGGECAMQ